MEKRSSWKVWLKIFTEPDHGVEALISPDHYLFRLLHAVCHNAPIYPCIFNFTVASWWARWRLKSPASWLFTELLIQAQIKEKHQSSASLAFVRGNSPVTGEFPAQRPVTREMFPFDDVIINKRPSAILRRMSNSNTYIFSPQIVQMDLDNFGEKAEGNFSSFNFRVVLLQPFRFCITPRGGLIRCLKETENSSIVLHRLKLHYRIIRLKYQIHTWVDPTALTFSVKLTHLKYIFIMCLELFNSFKPF